MLGREETFGVPEPPGRTWGMREGAEELPHSQWVFERQERRGQGDLRPRAARAELPGGLGAASPPFPAAECALCL